MNKSTQEEFEEMKNRLKKAGYKEKDVTIASGKATVMGLLYGLPFVIAVDAFYLLFLMGRAHFPATVGFTFYLTVFIILILMIVVHELLHGAGWALASGKGFSVVRFNINAMMPSCACKAALQKKQYLVGVLLPLTVLGVASLAFLVIYPGTLSVLIASIHFIAAGADIMIACRVMREKDILVADHPTQPGYLAFYKEA